MNAGKVYLIGAGPGDPGLLTIKGLERICRADVIVYDRLVHPAILAHARRKTHRELEFQRRWFEPFVDSQS